MRKVGTIQSIWRYPVKGMAGESLPTCPVSKNGLLGDRIWAVQDVARQEIQSCKFRPGLLQCRARQLLNGKGVLSGSVEVRFPDGDVLHGDAPTLNARISELIGHASRLETLKSFADNEAFYRRYKTNAHGWLNELKATFEREAGEPLPDLDNLPAAMREYVSVPGTFFLVAPLHMLTTASLAQLHDLNSAADWRVERFRPNLVIETLPGMDGLVEQGWLGKQIQIGELISDCVSTTPRCGAVSRSQDCLSEDRSILRSIVRDADQNLGIYGAIEASGVLNVGDEVWLR